MRSGILNRKEDPNRCSIKVTGRELVELKRHAHKIPECPGLDRRIQKYDGNKPLILSRDELDWLVAVLDAVLHDPKGYPCVQYDPWKLEYVPRTDERCVTCQRLYDRLNSESQRLYEISRNKSIKIKKREQTRERKKAEREKAEETMSRIQAVFEKRGCPAFAAKVSRGYTIFYENMMVSRIRQRDKWWEV
ncbi:MAG: hypothetical protein JXQ75_06780, partial [Phycisphaerae bacterium]|nr:hypothetical protein [Phycisphaerae bacterium]